MNVPPAARSFARALAPLGIMLAVCFAPASANAQFQVGLQDPGFEANGTATQVQTAYAAVNAVDGSFVRVSVPWAGVAPADPSAGFRPANPGDPNYDWSATDYAVRAAATHHLQVIIAIYDAPGWAQGPGHPRPFVSPGAWNPDPAKVAAFIHAVAVRYSGSFPDPLQSGADLPQVRYWEPWNEPNIPGYFSAPNPVSAYRSLLNQAYGVLKGVRADNTVILGGLAPVSPVPGSSAPLDFGAQLLCLHRVGSGFGPNRSCPQRTHFDVFGMHPYSLAASPTKHAYKPGDVLVGDMSKVGALVRAANVFHTAMPATGHQLWVTEFAWLTNPPNSWLGDRDPTAARYVAYSMYEMWASGVRLVIWFQVLDTANADIVGRGLYWSSGRPKLMLQAFAFPVVAGVQGSTGFVWGRAPLSRRAAVVVERAVRHGWQAISHTETGSDGVFFVRFGARGNGIYRARVVGGPTSLAYDSHPIPPQRTHPVVINF